jgi:hypothetical protein
MQLRNAPRRAHFVAPTSGAVGYTKSLAAALGRGDIRVVSPEWVEAEQYIGCREVVVDHAFWEHNGDRRGVRHFYAWLNTVAALTSSSLG